METVQPAEMGPRLAHRQQEHLHRPSQTRKQEVTKSRPHSKNETQPSDMHPPIQIQQRTKSRSQPQSPASKPPITSQSQSLSRPIPKQQSRSQQHQHQRPSSQPQQPNNCQNLSHRHSRRHLSQSNSANQQQSQYHHQLTRHQQLINPPPTPAPQAIKSSSASTSNNIPPNRPQHSLQSQHHLRESFENPAQPLMAYQHKHALHRLRRLKKRSPHRDLVISFVPRLRISIINRLDFFHRYSKLEQEVLSCFDFLDELVLNYCDEESVDSPHNSPKLYNSINYELI